MSTPIYGVKDLKRLEECWRTVAEESGGRYGRAKSSGMPTIEVPVEFTHAVIDLYMTDIGPRTRLRLPFQSEERFSLGISAEGWLDSIFRSLGMAQDVMIGDGPFDAAFMVKGHPVSRVKTILTEPVRQLLMDLRPIRIRTVAGAMAGMHLPPRTWLLEFYHPKVLQSRKTLLQWVELVRMLYPLMDPVAHKEPAEIDRLLSRVRRSGGDVLELVTLSVKWNLDAHRVEAARLLGESGHPDAVPALIEVLADPDDALVIEAIVALQKLGNARCVPALVRLLARRKEVEQGRSIAGQAADALRAFDHGALADAWDATMAGEPRALLPVVGSLRPQVIEALMEVVDSFDLTARIEAARALGALGAREALKLLREKTFSMGMKTKFAAAASEAVRAIEAQASLPRPASAEATSTPDTLPRPADATGLSSDNARLPRPSEEEPAN